MDALLPALGPQDGEQSTLNWLADGLDFPDYVEAAAPRPYAIVATTEDMFPFTGTAATERESRAFYTLFAADQHLALIAGPGGHANLKPLLPRILEFFTQALKPLPPALPQDQTLPTQEALVVTPTGQVSTSYPHAETVLSLNLKHARTLPQPRPVDRAHLEAEIRTVTHARVQPSAPTAPTPCPDCTWQSTAAPANTQVLPATELPTYTRWSLALPRQDGSLLPLTLGVPRQRSEAPKLAILLFNRTDQDRTDQDRTDRDQTDQAATQQEFERLIATNHLVLAFTPQPNPPGTEAQAAPQLGPFYLLGLRAQLVGTTLLGLRLDDVLLATNYLAGLRLPHQSDLTAQASGHLALVLLHAAVLDPRLTHVTLHHLPPTYRDTLATPMPQDLAPDLLPGVLLHYDQPDLIRALGTVIQTDNQVTSPPL